MYKSCKICGNVFNARGSTLTCSTECRKENTKRIQRKHDKKRAASKAVYDRNRLRDESVRARRAESYKKWYADNKDRKDEYDKAWRLANPEMVKAREKKRRSNPAHRLVNNVRWAIWNSLRLRSTGKDHTALEYLGCTGDDFAEYLVHHYAWKPWFTMENYGDVWHVDHMRPLASFNLSDPAEAKAAFHYTNCQPLGVTENISKGSNWDGRKHYHEK